MFSLSSSLPHLATVPSRLIAQNELPSAATEATLLSPAGTLPPSYMLRPQENTVPSLLSSSAWECCAAMPTTSFKISPPLSITPFVCAENDFFQKASCPHQTT